MRRIKKESKNVGTLNKIVGSEIFENNLHFMLSAPGVIYKIAMKTVTTEIG